MGLVGAADLRRAGGGEDQGADFFQAVVEVPPLVAGRLRGDEQFAAGGQPVGDERSSGRARVRAGSGWCRGSSGAGPSS